MTVAKLTTPGRYCDGLGLWLQVTETDNGDGVTKAWLFRYMRHGRARQMGLGALHIAKQPAFYCGCQASDGSEAESPC